MPFRNDYDVLAHPRILKALDNINDEHNVAYGLDKHSIHATELIKKVFDCPEADVHFIAGGTQTNLLFISYALRPYEGVISAITGHINVHETAAIEGSGHKIYAVNGKNGKVLPEEIIEAIKKNNDEHMVKIKMVYISNSTEIGTIYSKDELIKLHEVCQKHNLYLFIDGARLGSALTSRHNDVPYSLLAKVADGFYIGGTKNGLLFGEALVIVNKSLQENFRYHIKNKGAMLAKGYVIGAQFEEAFKDNLYFDLAKSTNELAEYLKAGLLKLDIETIPSQSNQIFAYFSKEKAQKIMDRFGCEPWIELENQLAIRFVISFKTTKEEVDELLLYLKEELSK